MPSKQVKMEFTWADELSKGGVARRFSKVQVVRSDE